MLETDHEYHESATRRGPHRLSQNHSASRRCESNRRNAFPTYLSACMPDHMCGVRVCARISGYADCEKADTPQQLLPE